MFFFRFQRVARQICLITGEISGTDDLSDFFPVHMTHRQRVKNRGNEVCINRFILQSQEMYIYTFILAVGYFLNKG